MDVICVNAQFTSDQLAFYAKHGVTTPKKEIVYTVRAVVRNTNGEQGLLLEEIINPHVPIDHPIMGRGALMEPNWSVKRFRALNNDELTVEMLREIIKEKV